MLQALGRLYIVSSRCEWYIGEIVSESGLGTNHKKTWKDATQKMLDNMSVICTVSGCDLIECIEESVRLSEILREFRNRMIHGFLADMNNQEGWIILKEKLLPDSPGEKISRDMVNQAVSEGDLSLHGYKHILFSLYHANGKMD